MSLEDIIYVEQRLCGLVLERAACTDEGRFYQYTRDIDAITRTLLILREQRQNDEHDMDIMKQAFG